MRKSLGARPVGPAPLVVSILTALAVAALCVVPVRAGAASPGAAKGDRYLIMAPHTSEECLKALDEIVASSPGLLEKIDWGCMAGDHTGYAIVQAASEEAARNMLPAGQRASAKVVKLNKFTKAQIKSFHEKG